MTNAAQGNPMIPSHPSIQAQHAQASTTGPSPSSNGATPPAQAPQASPQSFEMDWANLAMSIGDEEGIQSPQPGTQAPSGQSPQGQQAPQGAEQLTPEQKEAIARANMEAPPQPPQSAPSQQMSPQEATSKAVEHLLNTTYKLNDEQKQQLVSQPDVAIPQLAAQMHVQIATTLATYMHQAMQQMVPQMALTAMNKQMGAFKAEQTFFGQYPALNKPEFRPVVLQSLKLAKAYNPQATREQVMKEAAELAAFKLKVNLSQQHQQPQQQVRQPHTPAQAPSNAMMPFMPAPPGGAPAATAQQGQQNDNIFGMLADDPNW